MAGTRDGTCCSPSPCLQCDLRAFTSVSLAHESRTLLQLPTTLRIYGSHRPISLSQEENQHLVTGKMTINEMAVNLRSCHTVALKQIPINGLLLSPSHTGLITVHGKKCIQARSQRWLQGCVGHGHIPRAAPLPITWILALLGPPAFSGEEIPWHCL